MSKQRELLYKDGTPMREHTSKIIEELMSKQQTAVEWLVGKLSDECTTDYSHAKAHRVITLDFYTYEQFIQQAKAMEKEQIETAYNAGREFGCKHDDPETGEQYYNETYDREYAVWTEGYAATGESSRATFHGKYFAPSFRDAVLQYVGEDEDRKKYFSEKDGVMRLWGCRFFDNEKDARAKFG